MEVRFLYKVVFKCRQCFSLPAYCYEPYHKEEYYFDIYEQAAECLNIFEDSVLEAGGVGKFAAHIEWVPMVILD